MLSFGPTVMQINFKKLPTLTMIKKHWKRNYNIKWQKIGCSEKPTLLLLRREIVYFGASISKDKTKFAIQKISLGFLVNQLSQDTAYAMWKTSILYALEAFPGGDSTLTVIEYRSMAIEIITLLDVRGKRCLAWIIVDIRTVAAWWATSS